MRKFLKTTLLCGCISASLLLQVSCGRAGQETTQETAEVQTDAQTEAREKIVQKESAVQLLPGATGIDESKYDFDSVTMDDTVIVLDPSRQECAISAEEEAIGPGASEEKHKYTKNGQGAYSGQSEADLCLQVAKKARDELQDKGYKVFLTREDNDTLLSNTERSQIANKYKADVFVRINANSDKNGEKNGSFCIIPSEDNPYVSSMYGECRRLAESLIGTYCEETGMANGGCMERDDNIGINWSNMPVTVLELGYLTNQSDDYKMEKETSGIRWQKDWQRALQNIWKEMNKFDFYKRMETHDNQNGHAVLPVACRMFCNAAPGDGSKAVCFQGNCGI